MINKVEITNFRGIKHLELGLNRISIIAGKNDIGKSTALNAINWLITNKLLTDKYGDGENDIQSIVPNDHRKGEHTEVSIWLNTGTKYTKVLKRGYERSTGRVNKHETEYLINDSKIDTQKVFYETLYEQLGFTPKFTKLKVDESRLFTDPLYALLKLDYKELRALLVAMGCTVSNEELYKKGFEDMRKYEEQYLGKWDIMRKNLKVKSKTLDDDIKRFENQLQLFNEIDEYNDSNLKQLQVEREKLIQQKTNIKNNGIGDAISEIDNQKTKLALELESKRNNKKLEYNSKIKELEIEEKNLINTFNSKKSEATADINNKIMKINQELYEKKNAQSDLNLQAGRLALDIKLLHTEIMNKTEMLNKASTELGNLANGNYNDFECPVCGSPIDLHAAEHEVMINELSGKIENYQNEIEKKNVQIIEKKHEHAELENKINELLIEIHNFSSVLETLKNQKEAIEKSFTLDERASEIKAEIQKLHEKILDINLEFETENSEINALTEKRNNMILESQKAINQELEKINVLINENDELIKAEYTKQNDWERKCELSDLLKQATMDFNNNESVLARCNEFIKAMCKCINDKAKELTGFNFVMLEENLTNDGITECCYIVDDKGVPFKDINTARKTIMGIQFIEACRKIAGANNLPILADRLEGLDSDNLGKLQFITENQIICTRVTSGELKVEEVGI